MSCAFLAFNYSFCDALYYIMFFLTSLPEWCLEDEHEISMLS